MATKKSKDKKKPRPVKVNLEANMPRPGPISLVGPRHIIENARDFPLIGCWVMENWREDGITPVIVARQQAKDTVLYSVYLVDIYCLGVKNAYAKTGISSKRFEHDIQHICNDVPEKVEPSLAHELVYGSIAYAKRFGFDPHPDYKLARFVLEPEERMPPKHGVQFGKDGKPYFIAGPNDNANAILAKLRRTAGEGNFNYLMMLGDPFRD